MKNKSLEELRKEIDAIDSDILHILAKRMAAIEEVGKLKNAKGLPILDEKRREELLESLAQKAKELKVSKKFVKQLFTLIHDHAVELQKKTE
jgi:chorismate mutase